MKGQAGKCNIDPVIRYILISPEIESYNVYQMHLIVSLMLTQLFDPGVTPGEAHARSRQEIL